jgi:trehalose 6-phosphate phosphatase
VSPAANDLPPDRGMAEALQPLRSDPAHAAIFLDVDGTLAPIVRHADDAHVPDATRAPLIAVAKAYRLVGCVSGRQASVARRIVSLGTIFYVGNHGSELLRPGGTEVELDPEVAAWAKRIRSFARESWTDELHVLRVRKEDKGAIAAYHWRGAPDETAAELAVRELADRAEQAGFVTHWGRKVLEIRPPVALDKGRGIARLLQEADDVQTAMYVGDDRTDLDAFRGLRRLEEEGRLTRALCVGVRSEETPEEIEREADLLVDGPLGVRELLRALVP